MNDNFWIFKYKIYHIFFWSIYHYFWAVVAIGDPLEVASALFYSTSSVKFLFYIIFQAVGVYFNLYFLIPRFLEKTRFKEYVLYLILTILVTASLIVPGYFISAFLANNTVVKLYGHGNPIHFFKTYTLPSTVTSMMLAMSIKLTKNWVQTKQRQQLLEKEKLETELKFLKYQFNPHFLFNTINSIFFLIHKNPVMASDSLAKFSDLLRYQLFECNDKQISLSTEISYLQNFIELEKLRQNKNLKTIIDITEPETNDLGIAPFILMTFVENAFKHVSKDSGSENWIHLNLKVNQNHIIFNISNNVSPVSTKDVVDFGGIGLTNVKRRLELLYPQKYILEISNDNQSFAVKLEIHLSDLLQTETMQKIA